jgi:hypothetical protein
LLIFLGFAHSSVGRWKNLWVLKEEMSLILIITSFNFCLCWLLWSFFQRPYECVLFFDRKPANSCQKSSFCAKKNKLVRGKLNGTTHIFFHFFKVDFIEDFQFKE